MDLKTAIELISTNGIPFIISCLVIMGVAYLIKGVIPLLNQLFNDMKVFLSGLNNTLEKISDNNIEQTLITRELREEIKSNHQEVMGTIDQIKVRVDNHDVEIANIKNVITKN